MLDGLRPTADRIRETLFNWLQDNIAGETCLDLFSGSGALGIEALSRGAKQVDFVEKSKAASACIKENLQRFDITNATLECSDALLWLDRQTKDGQIAEGGKLDRYGLVFLDPPFSQDLLAVSCAKLEASGLMKNNCLVYIETDNESQLEGVPVAWVKLKSKKAGLVYYSLYKKRRNK